MSNEQSLKLKLENGYFIISLAVYIHNVAYQFLITCMYTVYLNYPFPTRSAAIPVMCGSSQTIPCMSLQLPVITGQYNKYVYVYSFRYIVKMLMRKES